jgi:hypothetical protein
LDGGCLEAESGVLLVGATGQLGQGFSDATGCGIEQGVVLDVLEVLVGVGE